MKTQEFRTERPDVGSLEAFSGTHSRQFSLSMGLDTIDLDEIARAEEGNTKDDFSTDSSSGMNLRNLNDDYEVLNTVEADSRCRVSEARDKVFKRMVAVKTLQPAVRDSETEKQTFLQEARIMAQLDHPAVLPIYNLCEDDSGDIHLAMKLVEGKTLRAYLNKLSSLYDLVPKNHLSYNEKRSLPRRLSIVMRLCEAMTYVHHRNVLLRSLSPEGITLGKYNEIYITDWHSAEQSRGGIPPSRKTEDSSFYLAPEIMDGRKYDQRADIYSIGMILYELVFLQRPFGDSRNPDHKDPPLVHRFGLTVSNDLKAIVRKAIHPDPVQRYGQIRDLADDIRNYLADGEVSARPGHIGTKIRRLLYRNKKFLVIFSTAAFLLCLSALTLLTVQSMNFRKLEHARSVVLSGVYARGSMAVVQMDRIFGQIEKGLLGIAGEAAARLSVPAAPESEKVPLYSYMDSASVRTAPKDFAPSKCYGQAVSMRSFVYKLPQHAGLSDLKPELLKLSPILASFRKNVLSTIPGENFSFSRRDELMQIAMSVKKPMMSFIYVSLSTGLHICYPYHDDYQAIYNPCKRPWYIAAAQESVPGKAVWGMPYLDNGSKNEMVVTCSAPIIDSEGVFRGCAGADIALDYLVEHLRMNGNTGDAVIAKYLLTHDGLVVADTSETTRGTELRYFLNMDLLRSLLNSGGGMRIVRENNRDILYSVAHLHALDWVYVEKIDLSKLLEKLRSEVHS